MTPAKPVRRTEDPHVRVASSGRYRLAAAHNDCRSQRNAVSESDKARHGSASSRAVCRLAKILV